MFRGTPRIANYLCGVSFGFLRLKTKDLLLVRCISFKTCSSVNDKSSNDHDLSEYIIKTINIIIAHIKCTISLYLLWSCFRASDSDAHLRMFVVDPYVLAYLVSRKARLHQQLIPESISP